MLVLCVAPEREKRRRRRKVRVYSKEMIDIESTWFRGRLTNSARYVVSNRDVGCQFWKRELSTAEIFWIGFVGATAGSLTDNKKKTIDIQFDL